MVQHSFLTSFECQKRAAECRSFAAQAALPLKSVLLLSRLADSWETLAVEIELNSPLAAI
jgi:hypothetical protein